MEACSSEFVLKGSMTESNVLAAVSEVAATSDSTDCDDLISRISQCLNFNVTTIKQGRNRKVYTLPCNLVLKIGNEIHNRIEAKLAVLFPDELARTFAIDPRFRMLVMERADTTKIDDRNPIIYNEGIQRSI
jgi:hypothetical protein